MVPSSALSGASMDHPDRQYWPALLGAAHGLRYELTGEPADRDAGIGYLLDGVSAGEFLPGVSMPSSAGCASVGPSSRQGTPTSASPSRPSPPPWPTRTWS
jgi:hypothetical protein